MINDCDCDCDCDCDGNASINHRALLSLMTEFSNRSRASDW